MTPQEIITVFGVAHLFVAGGIGLMWSHRFHRRVKREQEYAGMLGRSFRLSNRGHWWLYAMNRGWRPRIRAVG